MENPFKRKTSVQTQVLNKDEIIKQITSELDNFEASDLEKFSKLLQDKNKCKQALKYL